MVRLQPGQPRLFVVLWCLLLLLLLLYLGPRLLEVPYLQALHSERSLATDDLANDDIGISRTRHSSSRALFFNRVPKTGSEMLVLLLSWLQMRNTFTHVRLKNTVKRHLSEEEQISLITEVGQHIQSSKTSLVSFDRHVHFTNFSGLGQHAPTYINMLREPIEKLTSRFYYARATPRPGGYSPSWSASDPPREVPPYSSLEECIESGHDLCTFIPGRHYDLSIPYFCGHEPYCRELGNRAALARAKQHLTQHYAVVGTLEELNATLAVLEDVLPQFFTGVTQLYYKDLGAPHLNKNYQRPPGVSPAAAQALRHNLSLEMNFYEFARARLQRQFASIK